MSYYPLVQFFHEGGLPPQEKKLVRLIDEAAKEFSDVLPGNTEGHHVFRCLLDARTSVLRGHKLPHEKKAVNGYLPFFCDKALTPAERRITVFFNRIIRNLGRLEVLNFEILHAYKRLLDARTSALRAMTMRC